MVAPCFIGIMLRVQDHQLGSRVGDRSKRHLLRRARTAASLPGRVVACEDRTSAVEEHVVKKLDEMRGELAQLRLLIQAQLDADGDATELMGRLLQAADARLDALEQEQPYLAPQSLGTGQSGGTSSALT